MNELDDVQTTVGVIDGLRTRIAELEAALAERDELETLARTFIDKLKVIHADPAYQAVWTLAHLHHGPYHGPQYADDLRALSACVETLRARAKEGTP